MAAETRNAYISFGVRHVVDSTDGLRIHVKQQRQYLRFRVRPN